MKKCLLILPPHNPKVDCCGDDFFNRCLTELFDEVWVKHEHIYIAKNERINVALALMRRTNGYVAWIAVVLNGKYYKKHPFFSSLALELYSKISK
jgi:hypothetical protein